MATKIVNFFKGLIDFTKKDEIVGKFSTLIPCFLIWSFLDSSFLIGILSIITIPIYLAVCAIWKLFYIVPPVMMIFGSIFYYENTEDATLVIIIVSILFLYGWIKCLYEQEQDEKNKGRH